MDQRGDRKTFFRELLRESASVVRGIQSALQASVAEADPGENVAPDWDGWSQSPPRAAGPTTRPASMDEVLALSRRMPLETRSEEILRLARPSLRITRASEDVPDDRSLSRWGGAPHVPPEFTWPTHKGRALSFLGQFDLADLSRNFPNPHFPAHGLILFFIERTASIALDDVGCRVLFLDHEREDLVQLSVHEAAFPDYPIDLSLELTLPRSHSLVLDGLSLSDDESDAWDELRAELARSQGVELEELTTDWLVLHRLLGYPEELGGEMELDLEVASHTSAQHEGDTGGLGVDLERAREWQLLLQASDDGAFRVSDGSGFGRLYFWIRSADLDGFNFDGVRALIR